MRPIPRPLKFFLAGFAVPLFPLTLFLLFVGAVAATFTATFAGSESDIEVFVSRLSPNRTRAATLLRNMGGGAAGWCYRYIEIHPAEKPLVDTGNYIFRTNCQDDINFVWENDSVLRIAYVGDREISSMLQRKFSHDGAVQILYSGK